MVEALGSDGPDESLGVGVGVGVGVGAYYPNTRSRR